MLANFHNAAHAGHLDRIIGIRVASDMAKLPRFCERRRNQTGSTSPSRFAAHPIPTSRARRPPRAGLAQVVEKALVIREKKEKYVAREKEALLLCRHPMVVRLHSTFQVRPRHAAMF